ncbi:MAG: hypothetical protein AAFY60_10155 [Myxococcota bacterium]
MECPDCGDEIDEYVVIKVGRKKMKLCEDCADVRREEEAVAEEAEGVMREMMEYKGR